MPNIPLYQNDRMQLYHGDACAIAKQLPDNTIQTCITSPTYWGKRQFTDDPAEFGIETLETYVQHNVDLYTTILTKMRNTGSLFIIIQDTYMGSGVSRAQNTHWDDIDHPEWRRKGIDAEAQGNTSKVTAHHDVIRNKSLCGLPFRIANALVDLGFIWRELIIWEKNNPQPDGSVDRCRQSCEYVLHFTKSEQYTFHPKPMSVMGGKGRLRLRNQVWNINPEPKEEHTATFPKALVEPLLLGTSNRGDTVFEPFLGSATMLDLALRHGRKCIACDINKEFVMNIVNRERNGLAQWF